MCRGGGGGSGYLTLEAFSECVEGGGSGYLTLEALNECVEGGGGGSGMKCVEMGESGIPYTGGFE